MKSWWIAGLSLCLITGAYLVLKKVARIPEPRTSSEPAETALDPLPDSGKEAKAKPGAGDKSAIQADVFPDAAQDAVPAAQDAEAGRQDDLMAAYTDQTGASQEGKSPSQLYMESRIGQLTVRNKSVQNFGQKLNKWWDNFWGAGKDERVMYELDLSQQREGLFNYIEPLPRNFGQKAIKDFEKVQEDLASSFETKQEKKLLAFKEELLKKHNNFFTQQERWRKDFVDSNKKIWEDLKSKGALK